MSPSRRTSTEPPPRDPDLVGAEAAMEPPPRDPDLVGAEAAMRRAARRARERAARTAGHAVFGPSRELLELERLPPEARTHLREAAERIDENDWAGAVRESLHAVESVARQLDPEAAGALGPALKSIEKQGTLHPALVDAFGKLYGYASDEQGVRHALLDGTDSRVDRDLAVFMLGACASFASYLRRKHAAREGA